MSSVALSDNVAQVPKNSGITKLTTVNEATFLVGKRLDEYVTLPVAILAELNKLVLNGLVVEFRGLPGGLHQFLMVCSARLTGKRSSWRYVVDKEGRRLVRTQIVGEPVEVLWVG